jgi:hypothetical protein
MVRKDLKSSDGPSQGCGISLNHQRLANLKGFPGRVAYAHVRRSPPPAFNLLTSSGQVVEARARSVAAMKPYRVISGKISLRQAYGRERPLSNRNLAVAGSLPFRTKPARIGPNTSSRSLAPDLRGGAGKRCHHRHAGALHRAHSMAPGGVPPERIDLLVQRGELIPLETVRASMSRFAAHVILSGGREDAGHQSSANSGNPDATRHSRAIPGQRRARGQGCMSAHQQRRSRCRRATP